ncbi:MAG TPA: hypothetical protein VEZ90_00615, partial [Blastocatellia bacterium]|nr:hypothetical protein [Blastocatellia bacterium]
MPAEAATPGNVPAIKAGTDTFKLAARHYRSLIPKFRALIRVLLRSQNPFRGSLGDAVHFAGCPVTWAYDPSASGYRLSLWLYVPKTAGIFRGKLLVRLFKNPLHNHAPDLSIQFSRKLFPSWADMMGLLSSIFISPTTDLRLRRLDVCAHLDADLHHV